MCQFDLLSMGELLVDFTPVGVSENGNPVFERNPGGGPANVACAAARLGARTAFCGKVGDDTFGRALRDCLNQNCVDTQGLVFSPEYQTTLAFVHLDAAGDRSFSFYRRQGADTMLKMKEIDLSLLHECRYFYCSSVMMSDGPSRETSFAVMEQAKSMGVPVAFDPNLRPALWSDLDDAKNTILRAFPFTDILKLSEEEFSFLTGQSPSQTAVRQFCSSYPVQALLLTKGPKGGSVFSGGHTVELPAYPAKTIDTTAAGDAFTGAFLCRLAELNKPINACTKDDLLLLARFANAAGGLTTAKKGAISALPTRMEVDRALQKNDSLRL